MNDTVPFSRLDRVLRGLGFVTTEVPGSHVAYEHRPGGAVLVLRPHREEEAVDATTLAVVRRTLVENGLIDRDRLDGLLRERSMAG